MEKDPRYIDRLRALPEKLRRAYLEGDRDVFDGQYFDEFRRKLHVTHPQIPIEGVRKRIVAFDYGYSNPSAVYRLALMNSGEVIVYRELYVTKQTYRQLGLRIKAMTTAAEEIDAYIADPAIVNKKNEVTGTSAKQEFAAVGIGLTPAQNSRVDGWNIVRRYLQPLRNPNNGRKTALLKIAKNCVELIRTLPMLQHDPRNNEDLDTRQEDHAADALRYGLMHLGIRIISPDEIAALNDPFIKKTPSGIMHVDSQIRTFDEDDDESERYEQSILDV